MKLFKKIAAIMLSIMMVLGMASVVSAEGTTSGKYGDNNGTITISNAIKDHTYTIYRILKLESFSGKPSTGTNIGNYAYTVEDGWDAFVSDSTTGGKYLTKDSSGYVTWKTGVNENDAANLAKEALEYAKKTTTITPAKNAIKASGTAVIFSELPLGYYLVASSGGALCSLDTTAKDAKIQEKNGVPSVDKKVQEDSEIGKTDEWAKSNTADIGQTVYFQTTITAQSGAQNYVLHDKMDDGLTFTDSSVAVKFKNGETEKNLTKATDYTLTTSGFSDGCTFEIAFTKAFCNTLAANDQIIVTYSATLDDNGVPKQEYKNETWLKYGENSNTTHDTTTTKTYSIPVFKYTMKNSTETPLAGATFTLSKKSDGLDPINLVSVSQDDTTGDIYRVAKENETTGTTKTTVTTTASGKFTIQGLDADTYYLTETQQPAGYNKLKDPVQVVIDGNGNITIGTATTTTTEVKVENKTGSILPSTGGSGTTLIYILGAILVLGSSVVLITKKRMR